MSPLTNQRTDDYGSSFENRTRFLFRVIQAIRHQLPDCVPLSLRISAIEWMDWSDQPSWDIEQSISLAKLLPGLGVDILDVSSGGNSKDQKINISPNYQIDLAKTIRTTLQQEGIQLPVAAVGFITSPQIARDVVQIRGPREGGELKQAQGGGLRDIADGSETDEPPADLVFVGRQFLREPEFVLRSAQELGVDVQWPFQYETIQPRVEAGTVLGDIY